MTRTPLIPHPDLAPVLVGIDGSSASELARPSRSTKRHAEGYLVALLAWSDWTAHGSPAIEWSTLQSVGGKLLAERWPNGRSVNPDVLVRRVVVPDRAASHLVMRSESAQLVSSSAVTVAAGSRGCSWAR